MHRKKQSPKLTRRNQRERLKVRYGLLLLKGKRKTQVHLADTVMSVYTRYGLSCQGPQQHKLQGHLGRKG